MLLFVVFLGAHILQNFNVFLQWIKLMWRFVGLCAIAGQDHLKKSVHSLITWSDWGGGVANCFDSFTEIKVESRRFYKVSQEVLPVVWYTWHVLPLFSPEEHDTVVLHHEVTTCCVCGIYFRSRSAAGSHVWCKLVNWDDTSATTSILVLGSSWVMHTFSCVYACIVLLHINQLLQVKTSKNK